MTSTEDKEKRKITYRRLLLAKQLYLHGLNHSREAGELNKMIAVCSLHNAIEVTIRAIFLHYEIRAEKQLNIDFESMLSEIDNFDAFKTVSKRLPYRQELRNLNIVRNMVQHHAHEPEAAMMDEWRVFSYRFLARAFQEYFNEDFDTVSPVGLIADHRLRSLLELALAKFSVADWKAVVSCAKLAFFFALDDLLRVFPSKGTHSRFAVQSELRRMRIPDKESISRTMEKVLDGVYEKVGNVEYMSVLLSSGVSLIDYKHFQSIPLQVSVSENGTAYFTILGEIIEEDARWIHGFVVDSIVKWQLAGFSPAIDERFAPGFDKFIAGQQPASEQDRA
jgi:hypothetical protein